jgi:hypothetical protein
MLKDKRRPISMNTIEIVGLVVLGLIVVECLVNFADLRRYVRISKM